MTRPIAHLSPVLIALLASASAGAEQNAGHDRLPPLLPRTGEIALGRSAAPKAVADDAAVYVLTRGGFVLAEPGRNGFSCLVERSHPDSLEPICYDSEGSEAILPAMLDAAADARGRPERR